MGNNINYFIIGGCFRSGTTALILTVSKHSEIACVNENFIFYNLKSARKNLDLYRDINSDNILHNNKLKVIQNSLNSKSTDILNTFVNEDFNSHTKFFNNLIKHSKKKNIKCCGDKIPTQVNRFKKRNAIEGLKYIHIIRDPRKIIESQIRMHSNLIKRNLKPHFWMKSSIEECIKLNVSWYVLHSKWERIKNKINNFSYLEIKYEDIVDKPKDSAIKISKFLGVKEEEMIKLFKNNIKNIRGNKWKKKIPDVNSKLPTKWKNLMRKYGYKIKKKG